MGYKAFMMAIQNQISVLSKILATKIQHQQILEHQQAVTAKLTKAVVIPQQIRSRKSSNETSSQCGSNKEKVVINNTANNIRPTEMRNNSENSNNINHHCDKIDNVYNNKPIQSENSNNSNGCLIS